MTGQDPRRGFTIIEVMISMIVLAVGIMVIVSSFSMNLRQSSQTREGLQAALVMETLVEEVLDHTYGDPPPTSWIKGTRGFEVIIEGLPVQSNFVQNVAISKKTGNGSFFGQGDGKENTDVVTMTVTWKQPSGPGSSAQSKVLTANLTVARKP